jgi:hypothetical protein
MHWRKVPEKANGKVFYGVVLALTALVAVSTALLVLHFPAWLTRLLGRGFLGLSPGTAYVKGIRMPEDSLIVITNAIKTAFIDHPSSGHGTTWDQITKSDEESIHLAKAVLIALRKAGYSISKVEDENTPRS